MKVNELMMGMIAYRMLRCAGALLMVMVMAWLTVSVGFTTEVTGFADELGMEVPLDGEEKPQVNSISLSEYMHESIELARFDPALVKSYYIRLLHSITDFHPEQLYPPPEMA